MKNYYKIIFFFNLIFLAVGAYCQNITSVQSGSFFMPTTWDCACVPTPGANITINHAITLNNDWAYSSGSITINASGSLQAAGGVRTLAIYGSGALTNNGTFQLNKLAAFSGTVANNGAFTVNDSLYMGVAMTNGANGTIISSNFFTKINLSNNGTISAVNLFNDGTFNNYDQCHLTNFFNNLSGQNSGTLAFNDFYNNAAFTNSADITGSHDFTNAGKFANTGSFFVNNDFLNADSLNHDALFFNSGHVYVYHDFSNLDSLSGSSSGQYCIAGNSANFGVFTGSFDFCDQTPPVVAPYVDLNSGTIGVGITYCATPCNMAVNDEPEQNVFVNIFPNPSSGHFFISSSEKINSVEVYDISGRKVELVFPEAMEASLSLKVANSGLYFVKIITESSTQIKHVQIF